uniref:DUF262 domain-containing protein n=1 Tax=Fulvivirga sp. TaxID=1931237 RepID=UPI004049FDE4
MKSEFIELSIRDLIKLIDEDKVDLNPEYQRNFIWSTNDQSDLVDTILKGYPLPNFFMSKNANGKFEMVDGQQRSKTIYRFVKGNIKSSKETGRKSIEETNKEDILNYKLPFVIINELDGSDSLRDYYVLINKKGKHLNIPEVNKSEFFDTRFMKLANDLLDYQKFIELNLFTEAVSKRMNDRAYVEELIGLVKFGIRDKKRSVEDLYKNDLTEEEANEIKSDFCKIIDRIAVLNSGFPIKKTRYKQKNDFYTFFQFILLNENISDNLLNHQYTILRVIDGVDTNGRQFIRPSNNDCEALRKYAEYCVTQSNSKESRENRYKFFQSILLNKKNQNNETLVSVLRYLATVFGEQKVKLIEIEDYFLLSTNEILDA